MLYIKNTIIEQKTKILSFLNKEIDENIEFNYNNLIQYLEKIISKINKKIY